MSRKGQANIFISTKPEWLFYIAIYVCIYEADMESFEKIFERTIGILKKIGRNEIFFFLETIFIIITDSFSLWKLIRITFFLFFFRSDFQDYAVVCFKEFGDRVKHWITLNEPLGFSSSGYTIGNGGLHHCSAHEAQHCFIDDSNRGPYIVAHHQLLAHAAAVTTYKLKYQVISFFVITF